VQVPGVISKVEITVWPVASEGISSMAGPPRWRIRLAHPFWHALPGDASSP
jgi:hypothetical protein